jgi:uroporphyrin-III C-methyltransferase
MKTTAPSFEKALPELAYGSVWLVSAGDGDPQHLSPHAVHALGTADAVIHDRGITQAILDLVKPPRYREEAEPEQGVERSIKLAQDGWRVVQLVEGDAIARAVECAVTFAERDIPFHIVPNAGEPAIGEAGIGLLVVRKPLSVRQSETGTLVVLIAAPLSRAAVNLERRQPPLSFTVSGLAG